MPVRVSDLAHRRVLLTAALGFALLDTPGKPAPSEVQTVRTWLDTRTGLGHIVTGMERQDYDLELDRHEGQSWRATFYVTGTEHSLTNDTGTAFERPLAGSAGHGVGGAGDGRRASGVSRRRHRL